MTRNKAIIRIKFIDMKMMVKYIQKQTDKNRSF